MKIGLWFLTFILLTFVSKNVPGQQVEWKRYRVQEAEFSIELPTIPSMAITYRHDERIGRRTEERVLGAYADGVAYSVLVFENPGKAELEEFINESSQRYGVIGNSARSKDLIRDGFPGRQYLLNDSSFGAIQYFVTNTRLLKLVAMGADIGDVRLSRFFSSLKLGNGGEGNDVVAGPGLILRPNAESLGLSSESIYKGKEVDQKVRLASKPAPSYTEKARRKKVMGTVVLRTCFTSWGEVDVINVVVGLPHGLTEQAILAAQQIKFVPGKKDGKFVSMWMQLEYNFNLY